MLRPQNSPVGANWPPTRHFLLMKPKGEVSPGFSSEGMKADGVWHSDLVDDMVGNIPQKEISYRGPRTCRQHVLAHGGSV